LGSCFSCSVKNCILFSLSLSLSLACFSFHLIYFLHLFFKNCVSDILNTIIISNSNENYKFYLNKISSSPTSTSSLSSSIIYDSQQSTNNLLVRTSMMITQQDTNKLVKLFLKEERERERD
jgi:hypothetical protein